MNNGHTLNQKKRRNTEIKQQQTVLWFIQRFIVTHNKFYSYEEYVLANRGRHVRCTRYAVRGTRHLVINKKAESREKEEENKYKPKANSAFRIDFFTETNLPVGQSNA